MVPGIMFISHHNRSHANRRNFFAFASYCFANASKCWTRRRTMTFTRRFSHRFFSEAIPDTAVREAIAFAEQPRPDFELDPENPKLAQSTPIRMSGIS